MVSNTILWTMLLVFGTAFLLFLTKKTPPQDKDGAALRALLDNLDTCVYISRCDTGELLYVNTKKFKEYEWDGDPTGKVCWRALKGKSTGPCEGCLREADTLQEGEYHTWEEYYPETGKYFKNTDSLITWTGEIKAYMRHTVDITDFKNAEITAAGQLKTQQLLSEILLNFTSGEDLEEQIRKTLEIIGTALDVNRVYLCKDLKEEMAYTCDYKWHEKSTPISATKYFPYDHRLEEHDYFVANHIVAVENTLTLPQEMRACLPIKEVKAFLYVAIYVGGIFWGFCGLDDWKTPRKWSNVELDLMQTVSGLLATALQRKNAEDTLFQTQQTLQSILDHVPISIFWKDTNFIYRGCNSFFSNLSGLSVSETIGISDYDCLASGADACRADDLEILKTGKPKLNFDEELSTQDGRHMWVRTSKVPIFDKNGHATYILVVTTDVTEAKQRELALHESQQSMRAIFNATNEMIFLMDNQGKIIHYNHVFAKIFEISENDPADRNLFKILEKHTQDQETLHFVGEKTNALIESREAQQYELMLNESRYEVSAYPIIENETLYGISVYAKNVTLKKQAEENLHVALQSAEKANNAKSEFLSHMSHEIRTPMNAIIGMTRIALQTQDTSKIRNSLEKIEISSKHLLSIINDILDMSKIEAHKLELLDEPFNFEKMLADIRSLIGVKSREKKQNLIFQLPSPLCTHYIGDGFRLAQVITNLLSNAVKFTSEQGTIVLSALEKKRTGNEVILEISVSDAGIGIAPDQIEKLFDPFEQGDSGTARKFGGTGLGLVICKNIVGLMGGTINVKSEVGQGSTFTFDVHLKIAADKMEGKTVPHLLEIPDLSGYRILVVDDIKINQEIIKALLEETNVTMDFANDGHSAIEKFKDTSVRYDLILMDIQMPFMDGYQATHIIRSLEHPDAAIPIMAMTANAFKEDIDRCLASGMNDHIAKPINERELYQKIAAQIKNRPSTEASEPAGQEQASHDGANKKNWEVFLPFIDVKQGLERLIGNRKLYVRLLQKWQEDPMEKTIEAFLVEGDTTNAINELHTLKGVSANLSLEDLREKTFNLESSLKKDIREDSHLELFRSSLSKTREFIPEVIEQLLK